MLFSWMSFLFFLLGFTVPYSRTTFLIGNYGKCALRQQKKILIRKKAFYHAYCTLPCLGIKHCFCPLSFFLPSTPLLLTLLHFWNCKTYSLPNPHTTTRCPRTCPRRTWAWAWALAAWASFSARPTRPWRRRPKTKPRTKRRRRKRILCLPLMWRSEGAECCWDGYRPTLSRQSLARSRR